MRPITPPQIKSAAIDARPLYLFTSPSTHPSLPPPPAKTAAMLLYEDILTGDEMFSDAFPMCVQWAYPTRRSEC